MNHFEMLPLQTKKPTNVGLDVVKINTNTAIRISLVIISFSYFNKVNFWLDMSPPVTLRTLKPLPADCAKIIGWVNAIK